MQLSSEQCDFFFTNGYLVINDFFAESVCDLLKQRIETLLENNQTEIPKTIFSTQTNEHAKNNISLILEIKFIIFLSRALLMKPEIVYGFLSNQLIKLDMLYMNWILFLGNIPEMNELKR